MLYNIAIIMLTISCERGMNPNSIIIINPPKVLYLTAFAYNTASDWLNHKVQPIRNCVTFKFTTLKFTKSWRKTQRPFLRMVGDYEPNSATEAR